MSELPSEHLPHLELPVGEHVRLRQLQPSDAEALFTVTDSNREYLAEWLPWVEGTTSSVDSRAFIDTMLERRQAGAEYGYGIVVDGRVAGHISLMHLNDGKGPEIGYWIAEDVSGGGRTTAVAQAVSDFGFETLGLPKIIIRADPKNGASNRIAEKLGYTLQESRVNPSGSTSNIWVKEKTKPSS